MLRLLAENTQKSANPLRTGGEAAQGLHGISSSRVLFSAAEVFGPSSFGISLRHTWAASADTERHLASFARESQVLAKLCERIAFLASLDGRTKWRKSH